MDELPWPAKLYIAALTVVALMTGGALLSHGPILPLPRLGLAALLTSLLALALAFPLRIAPKVVLSLHTGVLFAATLLFPPGIAVVIAASGIALADGPRRQPLDQTLFNAAQLMLQVAAGGALLGALGWTFTRLPPLRPLLLIGLAAAALVMTMVEGAAVAGMVGLQTRQSLLRVWRQIVRFDPLEGPTQYVLGVLAALTLDIHPWTVPLLILPALTLYRSAQRQLQLQTYTAALEHQAFHDTLTGLPNRALLLDRLQHALERTEREPGCVGVLFVDLDGFKAINDKLGHAAGDETLRMVARRLRTCVRPGDTVARFGGDEFVVLLEELHDVVDARQVAERIEQSMQAPLVLDGDVVTVTASIGIALQELGALQPEALLRDADAALYQAKACGKAGSVVFDGGVRQDSV